MITGKNWCNACAAAAQSQHLSRICYPLSAFSSFIRRCCRAELMNRSYPVSQSLIFAKKKKHHSPSCFATFRTMTSEIFFCFCHVPASTKTLTIMTCLLCAQKIVYLMCIGRMSKPTKEWSSNKCRKTWFSCAVNLIEFFWCEICVEKNLVLFDTQISSVDCGTCV